MESMFQAEGIDRQSRNRRGSLEFSRNEKEARVIGIQQGMAGEWGEGGWGWSDQGQRGGQGQDHIRFGL